MSSVELKAVGPGGFFSKSPTVPMKFVDDLRNVTYEITEKGEIELQVNFNDPVKFAQFESQHKNKPQIEFLRNVHSLMLAKTLHEADQACDSLRKLSTHECVSRTIVPKMARRADGTTVNPTDFVFEQLEIQKQLNRTDIVSLPFENLGTVTNYYVVSKADTRGSTTTKTVKTFFTPRDTEKTTAIFPDTIQKAANQKAGVMSPLNDSRIMIRVNELMRETEATQAEATGGSTSNAEAAALPHKTTLEDTHQPPCTPPPSNNPDYREPTSQPSTPPLPQENQRGALQVNSNEEELAPPPYSETDTNIIESSSGASAPYQGVIEQTLNAPAQQWHMAPSRQVQLSGAHHPPATTAHNQGDQYFSGQPTGYAPAASGGYPPQALPFVRVPVQVPRASAQPAPWGVFQDPRAPAQPAPWGVFQDPRASAQPAPWGVFQDPRASAQPAPWGVFQDPRALAQSQPPLVSGAEAYPQQPGVNPQQPGAFPPRVQPIPAGTPHNPYAPVNTAAQLGQNGVPSSVSFTPPPIAEPVQASTAQLTGTLQQLSTQQSEDAQKKNLTPEATTPPAVTTVDGAIPSSNSSPQVELDKDAFPKTSTVPEQPEKEAEPLHPLNLEQAEPEAAINERSVASLSNKTANVALTSSSSLQQELEPSTSETPVADAEERETASRSSNSTLEATEVKQESDSNRTTLVEQPAPSSEPAIKQKTSEQKEKLQEELQQLKQKEEKEQEEILKLNAVIIRLNNMIKASAKRKEYTTPSTKDATQESKKANPLLNFEQKGLVKTEARKAEHKSEIEKIESRRNKILIELKMIDEVEALSKQKMIKKVEEPIKPTVFTAI